MGKVRSRLLVIDASIAKAAGEVSTHPTSRNCREFLQTVLKVCHRMVMTDPIRAEWRKHQSRFARQWQTSMMARRKVEFVEVASHLSLEQRITRIEADAAIAAVMEKDRRLIEAALVTEQRVISLDDRMREHLRDHVSRLPEVQSICWVNPNKGEERAITWLESGAPAERKRMLKTDRPRAKE